MFMQWILTILVFIGIGICGYLLIRRQVGCKCKDKSPEAIRLMNLRTKLDTAKKKADVLATTEGVGEQLEELREEIKEHEIEIADILGKNDE